jgi:pyridoxal/pyridoxine/pyridoxamine kinase
LSCRPSDAKSPASTPYITVSDFEHEVEYRPLIRAGNHTAYKQVKGRKTTPEEILELYEGLKQSYLDDFDVLLSGYVPSAEDCEAVGKIGRDLRFNATIKPGSFFWGKYALLRNEEFVLIS